MIGKDKKDESLSLADMFGSSKPVVEASAAHRDSALTVRSIFQAYLDSGFTETQAMELVKASLMAGGNS